MRMATVSTAVRRGDTLGYFSLEKGMFQNAEVGISSNTWLAECMTLSKHQMKASGAGACTPHPTLQQCAGLSPHVLLAGSRGRPSGAGCNVASSCPTVWLHGRDLIPPHTMYILTLIKWWQKRKKIHKTKPVKNNILTAFVSGFLPWKWTSFLLPPVAQQGEQVQRVTQGRLCGADQFSHL